MKKIYFDKTNLKSKFFKKMFLSYVAIIVLLLIIYSLFIFMETRSVGRERQRQYYGLKLEETANDLNRQISQADNIISNIKTSEVIGSCVWKMNDDSDMSRDISAVNSAIRSYTHAANNFNIIGTYLFIEGLDKVFSNTDAYTLSMPFKADNNAKTGLAAGNVADIYGISHSAAVFNKTCLIYITQYENIAKGGSICILFDINSISDDLGKIMADEDKVRITADGHVLYEKGSIHDPVDFEKNSSYNEDITYRLTVDGSNMYIKHNAAMLVTLVIAFVLGLALVVAAFWMSCSYYRPVGNITRIVADSQGSADGDEFDNIINGIETLIGERNGYREKMISISPYIRQGMFYGIMNQSLEPENINLFTEDEYTVLQKPYFAVGIVNTAYVGNGGADPSYYKKIKKIIGDIAEENSGEGMRIVIYDKDINNIFVIVNADAPEGLADTFYKIYDMLVTRMDAPDYAVTIGVDAVRESLSELPSAVNLALRALDNIMAAGRGAVYFNEDNSGLKSGYYFPRDTAGRVTQALRSGDTQAVRAIFADIADKNIREYDLTPAGASLLADEIHITTIKAVREANIYNTIDFDIRKPDMVVPLEELVQYYCAIYEAVCDQMSMEADRADDMDEIDRQIIECIDRQFADENMSLQYLTEKFGMSNKYITMLCKKRFGKTYLSYIQEKRIGHAIELMRSGSCSLESIASACGYTNMLTFRRNFKAVTGVNPSEYSI